MRNGLIAGISLLVLGLAVTAIPARAGTVDVGASGIDGNAYSFDQNQWLGAQFTLSGTTQVSTVSLGTDDLSATPYTVEIVNNLPGGMVEWSSPSVSTPNPVFAVSFTLPVGTYYLIGPTTGGFSIGGWAESGGALTEMGGSVGPGVFVSNNQGNSWTFGTTPNPLQFDIIGTNGSGVTPEPSSLLLLGSGLLGLAPLFHRRARTTA